MKKHYLQIQNNLVVAQSFALWPNRPANIIEAPDNGNYLDHTWDGETLTAPIDVSKPIWPTGEFILAIGEDALDVINSHASPKAKMFSQYLNSESVIDLNITKLFDLIILMKDNNIIDQATYDLIQAG